MAGSWEGPAMEPQTLDRTREAQIDRTREQVAKLLPERAAFTVEAFCISHSISRAHLYQLWKDGLGPKRIPGIGRKVLISVEAAREWRSQMEAA